MAKPPGKGGAGFITLLAAPFVSHVPTFAAVRKIQENVTAMGLPKFILRR